MPWVVAEFLPHREYASSTVQTIPAGWLCQEKGAILCFYPPEGIPSNHVKRLIQKESPPSLDWDVLSLHFVSDPYDDFIQATAVEIKAAEFDETDLEGYFQNSIRAGKRVRKAKKVGFPGEEESTSEGSDNDHLSNPPSPPPPAKAIRVHKICPDVAPQTSKVTGYGGPPKKGLKRPLEKPGYPEKKTSGTMMAASPGSSFGNRARAPETSAPKTSTSVRKAGANCVPSLDISSDQDIRTFIEEKMRKLGKEIKAQVAQDTTKIFDRLDALETMIKGLGTCKVPSPVEANELLELMPLPLNSVEELWGFEEEITQNVEYRVFMIARLADRACNLLRKELPERLFGNAINKTVNEVCSQLMTNGLAREVCLKKKLINRISLEDSCPEIIAMIYEVVKGKSNAFQPVDLITVKRSIGEWLRQARNRAGGRTSLETAAECVHT